ncbi:Wound-induced polypeptide 3 [Hibiscus trionum]|uniref:Wound-induced polypeptide 3 n=1 Tax=Hibiscus trionum TaxID=183268 RepID=A0A9W7M3L6_HIBTR|nr:Wound-induced polypeptide 3 [Hibiscus trionum]
MSSWKSKASWAVAATTVKAAEVSNDKKLCIWSSAKHRHQTAINKAVGSSLSSASASASTCLKREEMRNQSEESLRTIMYLSCWGPN